MIRNFLLSQSTNLPQQTYDDWKSFLLKIVAKTPRIPCKTSLDHFEFCEKESHHDRPRRQKQFMCWNGIRHQIFFARKLNVHEPQRASNTHLNHSTFRPNLKVINKLTSINIQINVATFWFSLRNFMQSQASY